MPDAHVFLPCHFNAVDLAFGQPGARRFDAVGVARMPGSQQSESPGRGELLQDKHLAGGHARRLFQQYVATVLQRRARGVEAGLGCGAQGHRL